MNFTQQIRERNNGELLHRWPLSDKRGDRLACLEEKRKPRRFTACKRGKKRGRSQRKTADVRTVQEERLA